MTILVTADLHFDLWTDAKRDPVGGILPVLRNFDALIIAGDLTNDSKRNWPWALSRIARPVSPAQIWMIPSNHTYYGATLDDDVLTRISDTRCKFYRSVSRQTTRPALSNIGGLSCHWTMSSGIPLYADHSLESSMSVLPVFVETDTQRRLGFGLPFCHQLFVSQAVLRAAFSLV